MKVKWDEICALQRERQDVPNWGSGWSGSELEAIADRRYSATELALTLGRSANAVRNKRRQVNRRARLAGEETP